MTTTHLETDYLIIGSGAVGMAFADTLFHESKATMVIVDKHHGPGGHWNDAYPFVRLHQPSSFYGVNSRKLGADGLDSHRLNVGMTERASSAELLYYYECVMQEMLASGRVRYLPMTEYQGEQDGQHGLQALLSGARTQVKVHQKIVDTTYLNTSVPSTHPPKYAVAPGVTCMPLNNLTKIKSPPPGYVVVGAGKTGIDACLWLLDNQVAPEQICWIMPRDSWFQNRTNVQAGDAFLIPTFSAIAAQFEAIVQAESVSELFHRLETSQLLLRMDKNVEPGMYHAAVVSMPELEELRTIENIVRLGRVQRIEKDQIILERGTVPMAVGSVVVDCSASAAQLRPAISVFQGQTITPQFIQAFQPTFSAALIAHVEAHYNDEALKNKLCKPVPLPDTPITWLTMQAASMANRYHWNRDKGIAQWILKSRLDGFTKMMDNVQEEEADKVAVLERMGASAGPAVAKMQKLLETMQ